MSEMDRMTLIVALLICATLGAAMAGWMPLKWARRVWGIFSAVCDAGALGLMIYGIVTGG